MPCKLALAFVSLLFITNSESARNAQIIVVDLSGYTPNSPNGTVFKYKDVLTEGKAEIIIRNVSSNVGFFVVQVHTYLFDVGLSRFQGNVVSDHVNGTNVGLVQVYQGDDYYRFVVASDSSIKISVLIVVVVYDAGAPIPGGCNLTFNTPIAPYQLVTLFDDLIRVDTQAPSLGDSLCELTRPKVEFYHLYLKERDYSETNYFDGLEKMLTVEDVVTYGNKIPGNPAMPLRNYYSAYRGTGAVFGVVATYKHGSSAYVPAVSYACDVLDWDADCNGPVTLHWKLLCAFLLFLGFFVCYCGHRFFRTSLFFAGFISGTLLTYIALMAGYTLSFEDSTITSCAFGVVYGAFWLFLWWRFGVPLFSVHLSFLLAGILTASIVYYSRVQDYELFRNNVNYWLLLVFITLALTLLLSVVTCFGHVAACSFLGSYAIVATLSHYVGANLQYIIVNTFRRATVEHFSLAAVDPPFQAKDLNLVVSWTFFFLSGIYAQMWLQRGKPPFPPNRALLIERNRENTPLLVDSAPGVVYTE